MGMIMVFMNAVCAIEKETSYLGNELARILRIWVKN